VFDSVPLHGVGHGIAPAPETIIEPGSHWTIVLNRNQNLLGKVFLWANRPVEQVIALTNDEWLDLRLQMRRVTLALIKAFQPDHFNYAFLQNQDRQVHLHVIPRYATPRTFEGLAFSDPDYPNHYAVPSPPRRLDTAQMGLLRDLIRASLPEISASE
jgi:diadenosine tetraphosphate (Ap4A) HIT family hydrolase